MTYQYHVALEMQFYTIVLICMNIYSNWLFILNIVLAVGILVCEAIQPMPCQTWSCVYYAEKGERISGLGAIAPFKVTVSIYF